MQEGKPGSSRLSAGAEPKQSQAPQNYAERKGKEVSGRRAACSGWTVGAPSGAVILFGHVASTGEAQGFALLTPSPPAAGCTWRSIPANRVLVPAENETGGLW